MNDFEYVQPTTIDEIFHYLKKPGALLKAGGIDILDLMKEGNIAPVRLVSIRSLKSLAFIKKNEGGLRIGPAITLSELAGNELLTGGYRAISLAARGVATPQVRNAATLGGNLCQKPRCWYYRNREFPCRRKTGGMCYARFGENRYHAILGNDQGCVVVSPSAMAIALIALDAKLKLLSSKGERTIAAGAFYPNVFENALRNREIIAEINLPPIENTTSFYHKQKEKQANDWPIAEVAVALKFSGKKCAKARIALGAVAPIPWRNPKAESMLKGQIIDKALAVKAAAEMLKNARPLAHNSYKLEIARTIVARAICQAADIDPL